MRSRALSIALVLGALWALAAPIATARASAYSKVLAAYESKGVIPPCSFTTAQLQAALRGVDDPLDREVGLARRRRPDVDGAVGPAHVRSARVGVAEDRDRLDPEPRQRALDPRRDLAPVRDQHALEHG